MTAQSTCSPPNQAHLTQIASFRNPNHPHTLSAPLLIYILTDLSIRQRLLKLSNPQPQNLDSERRYYFCLSKSLISLSYSQYLGGRALMPIRVNLATDFKCSKHSTFLPTCSVRGREMTICGIHEKEKGYLFDYGIDYSGLRYGMEAGPRYLNECLRFEEST